jgi:hypothetical protein
VRDAHPAEQAFAIGRVNDNTEDMDSHFDDSVAALCCLTVKSVSYSNEINSIALIDWVKHHESIEGDVNTYILLRHESHLV